MSSIRDMEPRPLIVGIKHFTDFAMVDEILRSRDFRQGSHQHAGGQYSGFRRRQGVRSPRDASVKEVALAA